MTSPVPDPRTIRWLIAAGLGCLGAGFGLGLAFPAVVEAVSDRPTHDPDEAYVRQMARRYKLTQDQVRLLRMVQLKRRQEIIQIFQNDPQRLPEPMYREYRDVMARANARIEQVLDQEQRRRFVAERDK